MPPRFMGQPNLMNYDTDYPTSMHQTSEMFVVKDEPASMCDNGTAETAFHKPPETFQKLPHDSNGI